MPSHSPDPDTLLSIRLGAIMTRSRYTQHPGPVIDELRATAGARVDLLAAEVGSWVGFYGDENSRVLTDALQEAFSDLDLQPHIEIGQARRYAPTHRTP